MKYCVVYIMTTSRSRSKSRGKSRSRSRSRNRSHSKSRSRPRTILPHPTKGALGKYSTKMSADRRRKILDKKVKSLGYSSVVHDLSLRATMNKNQNPHVHDIMRSDMDYLHREYRSKK